MTLQKTKAAAVMNIMLLLSLHVHPIAASRIKAHSQTHQQRGMSAAETKAQAFRAALSADAQEDLDFCGWGYSTTMRWYHFELDVAGEKENQVKHFAVELIRAPIAPRLVMHAGKTWTVRLTGDEKIPMDWVLTPLEGANATNDYAVEIDFLYEVEYVKKVPGDGPDGLAIGFVNGTNMTITGGLYYPDSILKQELSDDVPTDTDPNDVTPSEVVGDVSSGTHGAKDGANEGLKKVVEYSSHFARKGIIGGVAVGFGLSYSFSSAVALMNGLLNSFLAYIGMSTTIQVSIGIAPLTATQILTFTSYAGSLGLAGGAALGLGLGLVVGIPVGLGTAIHSWVKARKELQLSASEKIFAKLDCHRHFVRCGNDVLVPEGKECPPGTPKARKVKLD